MKPKDASGVPAEELAELSGRSSPPTGGSDTKVRVSATCVS
jgi:hypothetical protein